MKNLALYLHPLFWSILLSAIILTGCDPDAMSGNGDDDPDNGSALAQTYGGTGQDIGQKIIHTSDGGYLIAGSTSSSDGDFEGQDVSSESIVILKMNSNREIDWIKTLGGSDRDRATDLIEDSAGNYVITGFTHSNDGPFEDLSRGSSDIFLIKLSAQGELIWTRIFGGSAEDIAHALIQTPNNNYILAGSTRSVDFNFINRTNSSRDAFILSADLSGQLNWVLPFGGSSDDEARGLTQTFGNSIVASGTFRSSDGIFFGTNPGLAGVFIHEVDQSGNTRGLTTYEGEGNDIAHDITTLGDGGFAITGTSDSNTGVFDGLNRGGFDAFVLRLNFNLTTSWITSVGGSQDDTAYSVVQAAGNHILIAGQTESSDDNFDGQTANGSNLFLALLNSDGSLAWTKSNGGSNTEAALSATETNSGDFAVTGWTRSNDGLFEGNSSSQESLFFLLTDSDGIIK